MLVGCGGSGPEPPPAAKAQPEPVVAEAPEEKPAEQPAPKPKDPPAKRPTADQLAAKQPREPKPASESA